MSEVIKVKRETVEEWTVKALEWMGVSNGRIYVRAANASSGFSFNGEWITERASSVPPEVRAAAERLWETIKPKPTLAEQYVVASASLELMTADRDAWKERAEKAEKLAEQNFANKVWATERANASEDEVDRLRRVVMAYDATLATIRKALP